MYEFDDAFCNKLYKEYGDAYSLYLDLLLLYGAGRTEQVKETFIKADDSLKLSPDDRQKFRLEVEAYLQNKYGNGCTAEGFLKTYQARQLQRESLRKQEEQQVEREIEAILNEETACLLSSRIEQSGTTTKSTKAPSKQSKIKKPKDRKHHKRCKLQ